MSRKSRTLRKARQDGVADQPSVSRLKGPGDVAIIVPYLLGFQPLESLVLVALHGPRKRFGPVLRVDLVDNAALLQEQADLVVGVMATNRVSLVIVAAFSTTPERADPLARRVLDTLAEQGIAVEDAFRADGARWWSYTCGNPRCCSPDGVPYDVGTSRVAAEAVVSGLAFEADRDALRSQLAPGDPALRERVAAALTRVRGELPFQPVTSDRVEAAVTRALAAPAGLTEVETAWLALAVQTTAGLETAAGLVTRADAERHYEVWRTVTTRVGDELLPAAACLAGFAAWLDGRGVLASHAVDRVLGVEPGHPLARILAGLLVRAVNPGTWEEALRSGA